MYFLRGAVLSVSGTRGGRRFDCDISLHEVVGRPQRLVRRFWGKIIVGVAIAVPSGAITLALVLQNHLPEQAAHHYAHYAAVAFATGLGTALTWLPPLRYLAFRDAGGDTLFDIVEPHVGRGEFDEFLRRLSAAVSSKQRAHQAPKPTGTLVANRADARLTPSALVAQL